MRKKELFAAKGTENHDKPAGRLKGNKKKRTYGVHVFILSPSLFQCPIGRFVIRQTAEAAVEQILCRSCVAHIIAERVGQLEILVG